MVLADAQNTVACGRAICKFIQQNLALKKLYSNQNLPQERNSSKDVCCTVKYMLVDMRSLKCVAKGTAFSKAYLAIF